MPSIIAGGFLNSLFVVSLGRLKLANGYQVYLLCELANNQGSMEIAGYIGMPLLRFTLFWYLYVHFGCRHIRQAGGYWLK